MIHDTYLKRWTASLSLSGPLTELYIKKISDATARPPTYGLLPLVLKPQPFYKVEFRNVSNCFASGLKWWTGYRQMVCKLI